MVYKNQFLNILNRQNTKKVDYLG